MKKTSREWVFLGIGVMAAQLTLSAAPPGERATLSVGHASRHTVSPRLSDLVVRPAPQTGASIQVPLRVNNRRSSRPDLPGQADPLRQVSERPFPEAALTPLPSSSFEGLSDDDNSATVGFRVVPPDTNGDVGMFHYVQYINSIYAVYDKATGTLLAGPFPGNLFWDGAGGQCEANNDGDPIALYDHLANRWVVSQFAISSGTQCVAISQGEDPTGSYDRWEFQISPGENNDYPKMGVMPNAYYLSVRDFPSNDGTFASAVAFDRSAMLAGAATPTFVKFSLPCLSNNCPDGIQPPHLEGPPPAASTPGIFSRIWDEEFEGTNFGSDGYRLWEFVPDFATPAASTFTELDYIPSAGFDSTMCGAFQSGCIPQPKKGGGERLDPVDELQMYRAQYRHFSAYDSLLVSTTADATGTNVAGVRWAELRKSNPGTTWSLFQEGTYAPADGENRWMGSIAMNGSGDIGLGYSVSSTATFPSIRYVTRTSGDPLGTLPGGEVELFAGSGSQTSSSSRWGDYSSMSVDPVDDCTFWYTQEYYANNGSFDFKTRIGSFAGPTCGPACVPDEIGTEITCDDGLDNDCDGAVDCADSDCTGAPACVGCNLGQPGDACTNDSDCCSNSCKGKPGAKTCR